MMYIDFTKGNGSVQRKEYPDHYLVGHVLYQAKQEFGRDIKVVTVGCINNTKSDWQPDPAWPTIAVQKKPRKTFFGRYI
jgi:hypothetical protein